MKWKFGVSVRAVFLLASILAVVVARSERLRAKRGASVYPVFGSGGHAVVQSRHGNHNDPTPFIQYLSGQGTSGNSHGGSLPASSHASSAAVRAPTSGHYGSGGSSNGGHRNSIFDSNLLNTYTISSNHLSPASTTRAPSSSGWQPSSSHGYSGNFYTSYYGLLTPNFAQSNSLSTSYAPTHRPALPTLSASSLAHSAQSSFYAQSNLFDTLLAGARPQSYKGGSVGY